MARLHSPRFHFAGNPHTLFVEKALLPLRSLVVIVAALTIFSSAELPSYLWYLVTAAALYNIITLLLIRRHQVAALVSYTSPLVNGGLAVAGLLASGGLDSPLQPGLTLVLAAAALRQPFGWSVSLTSILLTAFTLSELIIPGLQDSANFTRLAIFCLFNFVLVLVVGSYRKADRGVQLQLLQVAAHELRNPMAGIKGILSLVRRRATNPVNTETSIQMLAVAERELDRLSGLVTEIVEAYRAQEGQLQCQREHLDLSKVVATALEPFAATPSHTIQFAPDNDVITVLGDAHRLQELVRNLVDNAVKYTPDGGCIKISLQRGKRWAQVGIADTGIGIPKDQIDHVFDRFFRARNLQNHNPSGMGLGLYICRQIVRQHSGRIWVESEVDHGTIFYVNLPLAS